MDLLPKIYNLGCCVMIEHKNHFMDKQEVGEANTLEILGMLPTI